jgi:hypothetical protein
MEAIALRSKVLVAQRGGGFRRRRKTPHALFLAPLILCKQARADSRKRRPNKKILPIDNLMPERFNPLTAEILPLIKIALPHHLTLIFILDFCRNFD